MADKNLMASMDAVIVAVDNGNGNTKTEHCVFRTGLDEYYGEPTVTKDYFKTNGRYYVAGENHMTYQGNKTENDDCYILTMIAVVKELNVVNGRFCPQSVRNFCPIVAGFNAGTYKVPACVL